MAALLGGAPPPCLEVAQLDSKIAFCVELLADSLENLLNAPVRDIISFMESGSGLADTSLASRIKSQIERTLFRHGRLNEFKKSHYAEIRIRCPDGHRLYASKHADYVCITYVWPSPPDFENAPQSGFELRFENDISSAECRVFGAFGHRDFSSIQPAGELEALHEMFNIGEVEGEVFESQPIE